jgi:hypothetical protein
MSPDSPEPDLILTGRHGTVDEAHMSSRNQMDMRVKGVKLTADFSIFRAVTRCCWLLLLLRLLVLVIERREWSLSSLIRLQQPDFSVNLYSCVFPAAPANSMPTHAPAPVWSQCLIHSLTHSRSAHPLIQLPLRHSSPFTSSSRARCSTRCCITFIARFCFVNT